MGMKEAPVSCDCDAHEAPRRQYRGVHAAGTPPREIGRTPVGDEEPDTGSEWSAGGVRRGDGRLSRPALSGARYLVHDPKTGQAGREAPIGDQAHEGPDSRATESETAA